MSARTGLICLSVLALIFLGASLTLLQKYQNQKWIVRGIVKNNTDYLTSSLKTHSAFYYVKDQPWMSALAFNAYQQKISLYPIEAVQYADSTKQVMLVASNEYAMPPLVYIFDTTSHAISTVQIESNRRGFFTSGNPLFENDTFDFSTRGGDAGCTGRQYFSYDSTTNKIKLTKESSQCENQKEESWTYY